MENVGFLGRLNVDGRDPTFEEMYQIEALKKEGRVNGSVQPIFFHTGNYEQPKLTNGNEKNRFPAEAEYIPPDKD